MCEMNMPKLLDDIEFNKEVLNSDDEEMRELAKQELPALQKKRRIGKTNSYNADT